MARIDLNADLGETVDGTPTGDDEAIFPLISSASIATGGHAGDDQSMRDAVRRAVRFGVAVGAHPSYQDRASFGRAPMDVDPGELFDSICAQLDRFARIGADIRYVKPHGALYNRIVVDAAQASAVARAVADAARRWRRPVALLGLGGSIERAACDAGVAFYTEAFLDRAYQANGQLVPRNDPGAMLTEPSRIAERAVTFALDGTVTAVDGTVVNVRPDSLCVHGDSPGAVAIARAVRERLSAAGITVAAPW